MISSTNTKDAAKSLTIPVAIKPLSLWWWAVVPVVFMIVQIVLEGLFDYRTLGRLHSEGGPHESIQFFLLVAALMTALFGLRHALFKEHTAFAGWFALAAVCCFYVAGEEVSWGQHIFEWATPEFWQQVNDQQETNLHNTSSWLDQKPRLLLEIGVATGGLIIPLLIKYMPAKVPARFALIYAPASLSVTAVLVFGLRLVDIFEDATGVVVFQRISEVVELYLYYFVFLYLAVLKRRAKALGKT